MRYYPHTYQAAKKRGQEIIDRLEQSDLMIPQCKQSWLEYLKYADPVEGAPQKNMDWHHVNFRNGYENDIPGLISEIISQCNLATKFCPEAVIIAQDKHTQRDLKIDYYITIEGVQSKTFRFMGQRMSTIPSYFEGESDLLALTDIDDKKCYIINRELLKAEHTKKRGYFYIWDLQELSVYHFNNENHY